jgi:hypothetical protein
MKRHDLLSVRSSPRNLVCDWIDCSVSRRRLGKAKPVGWLANTPQEATGRQAGRRLSGKDVGQPIPMWREL